MKNLIELAYQIAPDLFSKTPAELNIIFKPDGDECEYLPDELTAVMRLIRQKLTILKANNIDGVPYHQNLHFVILDVLQIVGDSYKEQPLMRHVSNKQRMYSYTVGSEFSSVVRDFIFGACKLQSDNYIIQQNTRLNKQEQIIDSTLANNQLFLTDYQTLLADYQALLTAGNQKLTDSRETLFHQAKENPHLQQAKENIHRLKTEMAAIRTILEGLKPGFK